MPPTNSSFDVAVIGAGFGGLATALRLVEQGVRVVVSEAVKYPGGCASTFEHRGYRFEAGATLFSGFGEGQFFRRWIDQHGLDVEVDWLDPVVEVRTPGWSLPVASNREDFLDALLRLPDAPEPQIRRFFRYQRQIADLLWALLDDPDLLPPFGTSAFLTHLRRTPRYLPLVRLVGRPLLHVLKRFDLDHWKPLRTFLDALCQITVQCSTSEAEAPFALGTMDYYFRGTGHVRGGIGRLAWAMVEAIRQGGGEVRFADRVRGVETDADGFVVRARKGDLRARAVAANMLPQDLRTLRGGSFEGPKWFDRWQRRVEDGWGACMLYRVVRPPAGAPPHPHHLDIVQDPSKPLIEGNHLFCSFSGPEDGDRAPAGFRTLTVSTHLPLRRFHSLSPNEKADLVDQVHERMRVGLSRMAPEWSEAILHEMTASPRTFERFTRRGSGFVGGIPRRAGLHHYLDLLPRPVEPGLFLVGDTVFPGQSTLATALGGYKLAEHLVRRVLPRK